MQNGLLREIAELRGIAAEVYGSAEQADHTEGIFQAIGESRETRADTGYKEFSALPLDGDPTRHPAFAGMLERMKLSTHQYAKSQIGWIKKQLLPAVREARDLGGEVWVYVVPGGAAGEGDAERALRGESSRCARADVAFLEGSDMPGRDLGHSDASTLLAILDDRDVDGVPDTAE